MLCRGQNGGILWYKVGESGSVNMVLKWCYLCGGIIPHPKLVTHFWFFRVML